MLRRRWSALVVALAVGCSGKDDMDSASGTTEAALCTANDLSDPDCESGSAVLRLTVTSDGQPAGAGLTVTATDCDGNAEVSTTDENGEARFNLPATTYVLTVEDPASGALSTPETHDLLGCQTTTLELAL